MNDLVGFLGLACFVAFVWWLLRPVKRR